MVGKTRSPYAFQRSDLVAPPYRIRKLNINIDLNLDSLTHRKSKEVENLNGYGGVLANISGKQVPKAVMLMRSTV